MIRLRLKAGVHPEENKLSAASPTRPFPAPSMAVVPFSQHAGKPAKPLVKRGEQVKTGQKIGEAEGFISAPVHSPVTGKVKAIDTVLTASGAYLLATIIERTGDDEWAEPTWPLKDPSQLSPEEIRQIAREAGLVGLGGAAFPTAVKLSPPQQYPIDTVILNGSECEPYLTSDHRLMVEEPEKILEGAELVRRAVNAEKVFIAIEDNKPDAIEAFEKLVRGMKGWEVVSLKTRYPQGAEKSLIKVILNREVPVGGLPFHVGVLVQNVGTAYSLYRAASEGKPLIERVVTVTGDAVKEPSNFWVRIGTSAKALLEACGTDMDSVEKVIFGGPMMGVAVKSTDVPVVKATSGILALKARPRLKEYPCLYCGRCVEVCPLGITPTRLVKYIKAGKYEEAKKFGLFNCMECGCCSYVCPSNIPLVHWIRIGKFTVRKREAS